MLKNSTVGKFCDLDILLIMRETALQKFISNLNTTTLNLHLLATLYSNLKVIVPHTLLNYQYFKLTEVYFHKFS